MRIRWLDAARTDLQEIGSYIARDRPGAAKEVVTRIRRAVGSLRANPAIGRPGVVLMTRELILPNLPYFIVYRVHEDSVDILWIVDGRQDWPGNFDVEGRLSHAPDHAT